MITADQLLLHAIGDYVLQSDWMAANKARRWLPAIAHVVTYVLPFLLLTRSVMALVFIAATHLVIDHWRLARHVCWLKNFLAPASAWFPWSACATTGYPDGRPAWLVVWLMIIADNVMHVVLNGVALHWLS